jgi:hypothetical protein
MFEHQPQAPMKPIPRSQQDFRGFALVVTVSLMVLLSVIAVGLLGLSAVALRSSSQGVAQAEAQANARLALMLAIGELQKTMGPDQRISARAEILDANPATPEADNVAHPHYLGVWDSWNTWLTDSKGSLSIQDTYKRGRDVSLFRRWLVSGLGVDRLETATNDAGMADPVTICGTGSSGPDSRNHVQVSRLGIRSSGQTNGKYAWWVTDESHKARLNLEDRDDAGSVADAQLVAAHTGRMGIHTMSAMGDFDLPPASLLKMVSTGQAGIVSDESQRHFHDLTAHSLGLLTDVRSGGFKADLNLAFESEVLPEQMDQTTLFGSGRTSGRLFDAPIRPMTGRLADIRPQNPYIAPMSWRQMREYYRLYRGGFADGSTMQPVAWERGKPFVRRLLMGRGKNQPAGKWEERDTKGYARDLVMLRQTWIIATKSETNPAAPGGVNYYVLCIPVVTLWNPYNITLKVDSAELSFLGAMYWAAGMRQRTYRGGVFLGETPFPDSTVWPGNQRPNHNLTANQLGYRMIPTSGSRSTVMDFQPGEVRVFSTDAEVLHGVNELGAADAMNSRHFFASPGYTPVQDTRSGVLRGLKYQVNPGSGRGDLSFSLRLALAESQNDNFFMGASRKAAHVWQMHEVFAARHGAVYENGAVVNKQGAGEWQDVAYMGATSVDWVRENELGEAWIIKDDAANRAQWPPPGSPPMPVGIFSIVAKSAERLEYDTSTGFADDFRNRSWLHAPPTRLANFLMNPVDLNRAAFPYQMHFRPVNGDQEVSQYLQANGPLGYFGGGYTPARGQTHIAALGIPTAPIVNLGSFAGIRMNPGRAGFPGTLRYDNIKHIAHAGAAFGAGIGNAVAHPMIDPAEIYTRNNFGNDTGWDGSGATNLPVTDDYWDHLFLANEELWDSWFCSGIAPVVANGQVRGPKRSVAEDFFSNRPSTVSPQFQPHLRDKTAGDLADLVGNDRGKPWEKIASHMLNAGQFNVNSTSKEAWKALLMSLADRPIAHNPLTGSPSVISRDPDEASLSRHLMANGDKGANGPGDDNAWRGIRKLSDAQIDKLAEEIVRQVKLRGPFLNMAEFINRRLANDDTGVAGALQAAIDWDEFNAGYTGTTSGTGESINGAYKSGDAMISSSDLPASYPNSKAATGSRYAGIPGYVMQSDILQGISSSISVRGDTFMIRAYGESLEPGGRVAATAWCEAVIQRMPDYVDPADPADKLLRDPRQVPGSEPDLAPANLAFGRQFEIVSFRWLNPNEI